MSSKSGKYLVNYSTQINALGSMPWMPTVSACLQKENENNNRAACIVKQMTVAMKGKLINK